MFTKIIFTTAATLFFVTAAYSITTDFTLKKQPSFSGEGTYLSTDKGELAIQTLTIPDAAMAVIDKAKKGDCLSIVTDGAINDGNIKSVKKCNTNVQPILEMQCTFMSSPTNSKMSIGPVPLIIFASNGVSSFYWNNIKLDDVQVDKQTNTWLGTAQSGIVKISMSKNVAVVKNEKTGVIGYFRCV